MTEMCVDGDCVRRVHGWHEASLSFLARDAGMSGRGKSLIAATGKAFANRG